MQTNHPAIPASQYMPAFSAWTEYHIAIRGEEDAPTVSISTIKVEEDDNTCMKLASAEDHALLDAAAEGDRFYAVFDATWIFDTTISLFRTADEAAAYLTQYADLMWDSEHRDETDGKTLRERLDPKLQRLIAAFKAAPDQQHHLNTDECEPDAEGNTWVSVGENVSLYIGPAVKRELA